MTNQNFDRTEEVCYFLMRGHIFAEKFLFGELRFI